MRQIPRVTALSRRSLFPGGELGSWLARLADTGVEAVQIREKDLADIELLDLVGRAVEAMAGRGQVLVNGRADVALAAGADGVHLPSDGIPVAAARRLAGEELLVGCSAHSLAEIDRARDEGADYAYYSPIFESSGKRPIGLPALAEATGRGLPVIALGGITIERLEAVAEAGASGIAAIRMFADPVELPTVVAAAGRVFGQ